MNNVANTDFDTSPFSPNGKDRNLCLDCGSKDLFNEYYCLKCQCSFDIGYLTRFFARIGVGDISDDTNLQMDIVKLANQIKTWYDE